MMRSIKILAVAAAVLFACANAHAFQVTRDSGPIDKLVDDANTAIFRGVCIGASPSVTREISVTGYTTYTFKVLEMIKTTDLGRGYQKGDTFTFNQAGLNTKWMPKYVCSAERNHEYLLFLACSEETRLCAPVGIALGVMDVARDPKGNVVVSGGLGREGLFRGVAERRPQLDKRLSTAERETLNRRDAGPVPYEELTSIIRKLETERGGR